MSDNTKQAGDVKRYKYDHADLRTYERSLIEDIEGDWVKFTDIAHLLKPQEPHIEKTADSRCEAEDISKSQGPDDNETRIDGQPLSRLARIRRHYYDGNFAPMESEVSDLFAMIEKLEAENKRLIDLLNASKETK